MHRELFFSFVYFIISLVKNKLLKIVLFSTEQFCSSDIMSGSIDFNLFDYIFVQVL